MAEGSKRTWKTLPVWFVILILIVGLIAATGAWMLRIESPVEYDEPFTVQYSDELNEEWRVIDEFPKEVEKESIDLTYGTYHDYIKITSERRRPVEINVTFSSNVPYERDHIDVGFAFLEGIVNPNNVTWEDGGTVANHSRGNSNINWGFYQDNITLQRNFTKEYTIITVLSNNAPLKTEDDELSINWEFRRTEVRPTPSDVDIPPALRRAYNLTPFFLFASFVVTSIIVHRMFKDIWEVK